MAYISQVLTVFLTKLTEVIRANSCNRNLNEWLFSKAEAAGHINQPDKLHCHRNLFILGSMAGPVIQAFNE